MIYIEKIENHKIGNNTPDGKIANSLGWTIQKEESEIEQAYDGSYWEKGYAPDKPREIKEEEVKLIRNSMLEDIEWRVARAREQRELGLEPVDDYQKLIEYKQYLRDYPESSETWYEENPKIFEEFKGGD